MSDDAIVTCDGKGNVTSWSATAERLFGCLADDVLDDPFELLFPEHLADEVRGSSPRCWLETVSGNFESEILRPDGMPLPGLAVPQPGVRLSEGASSVPWYWRVTSPNSTWRRPRWRRSTRAWRRARRWRTSGAGCGT